jgi:hypothetical protein
MRPASDHAVVARAMVCRTLYFMAQAVCAEGR